MPISESNANNDITCAAMSIIGGSVDNDITSTAMSG